MNMDSDQIIERWKQQSATIVSILSEAIGEKLRFVVYPAFLQYGDDRPLNKQKMVITGELEKVELGGEDYRITTVITLQGGASIELDNYQTIWSVEPMDRFGCQMTANDLNGDQNTDWKAKLDLVLEIQRS